MKKYLLLFLMCVYASIGAWADLGVSYDSSTTTLTVTFNSNNDITTDAANYNWDVKQAPWWSGDYSAATRVVFQMGGSVTAINDNILYLFSQQMTNVRTFDFSNLTSTQVGYITSGSNNFKSQVTEVVKNVIVPSGVTITAVDNNFEVNGGTVTATRFTQPTNVDWTTLARYGTTLKLTGTISSALDLGSATGFTTIDLTEANVSANISLNEDVVTTVNVFSSDAKSYIKKKDGTTAFDDSKINVPFISTLNVTGGSVQSEIEAYIANYSPSKTIADITGLNISGTLSSADVTYLSSLTGLETLNLTGLTTFGSGVSKSTIETSVGNGVTITYPNFFVDNNSTTGVITFTVLNAGSVTSAALTDKGLNFNNTQATIKVAGDVTASDITNIVALSLSSWNTRRLDFSEANIAGAMPRISGSTDPNDPYYIILPAGYASPTDEDVAYTNDNAHSTNNGIYNGYDDLQYIIIPAAEANGHAKIFVNKTKNGQAPVAAALQQYDIDLITANNPSVIDVYNLDGAFGDASFSTLRNAIDGLVASGEAWEGKSIVYHATMNPTVITGCNVTIDMNEANGKSLATLISEAKTEVVKTSTGICSLTINGPLASADITALNTAMGSGGDLASIESLNLGGVTGMTQAQVDALAIPSTLTKLTIPANRVVGSTLATAASNNGNIDYIYSPSSDAQRLGADKESQYDGTKNYSPDYAWIVKQGGLATAFANEEPLRNSFYIKVASSVALNSTDVDFDGMGVNKPTNYLFLDFSGSNLTPAVAAQYKVTDDIGYRIILPNNWTGDQMAVFAANEHCGALAAVYSYSGTTLKIMEIDDLSYNTSALSNPRIMRSGTTEVDVISGFYNGVTYSQFGGNLLAALNQMGDPANTVGPSVKTIVIETGINVPSAITFTNPSVETIKLLGLSTYSGVNVNGCTSLNTLDLKGSAVSSVTASGLSTLTTVDLTTSVIYGAADFSGSGITTLTTTDETNFNSTLNLTNTKLTSFATAARVVGDISLNGTTTLSSINVTATNFANTTSKIHIDKSTTEDAGNTDIIDNLEVSGTKTIKVPTGFDAEHRIHPYTEAAPYIEEASPVVDAATYAASDMVFHDKNANNDGDNYRYWYQGSGTANQIVTIGTSDKRTIHDIIAGNNITGYEVSAHTDLTSDAHAKIKVVGPLTANDIDSLKYLNATMIDLSDAVISEGVLQARIAAGDILHANTKFLQLPDSCTREHVINGRVLENLSNVYCVLAINQTEDGRDLTSWSRVAGALQPAVVMAGNHSANSWIKTPDGSTNRNIYTSDISNFKDLKISGLINSYDLSKANQQLNANGHLSWDKEPVELSSGTDPRQLNGGYEVYGPFSACFLLTEIDLKEAYFEAWETQGGSGTGYFTRYYASDMTLSALGLISTATYKVVIPQTSTVNEVPADFMNCSTNIRAICIPSNIRVIRTRAFYTIDYVWTTPSPGEMEGVDPEGGNTKLDNGAKLKLRDGTAYDGDGTDFIETSALIVENGKYKENPAFTKQYYTADYSTVNGGGTYTFGSNLRMIETAAFANTQPNVKDVYVLNTTAPECHVDAFNTVMYTGNGGYNPTAVTSEGIVTREAYYNGRWITMLHYPRQTSTPNVQRYTDPTREYSIATGERDGKGAPIYYPNQSEFIRAYQQGTYGYVWNAWNPTREYGSVNNGTLTNTTSGWSAENQTTANGLFDAYTTGGTNHQYTSFAGVNDSTSVTKTTTTLVPYYQVQYDSGSYSTAETQGNLYPKSEILARRDVDNSGESTAKDYRGWHQFVLNAYAANTILNEEPYRSYITDNEWWTICPTFDITREECAILFGQAQGIQISSPSQYPYVSKLRYVRRFYGDGKGTITLNFTQNLAMRKENRYQPTDKHGQNNSSGFVTILDDTPDGSDIVMSAGVPYLIKPNMGASPKRQFRVFKTQTDLNNFRAQFTQEQWDNRNFEAFLHESLYNKIKAAQEEDGATQMAHIHNGMYTVPVFVSESNGSGLVKENVEKESETPKPYHPQSEATTYYKSTDWVYTFVGSFYKSFLPHYCYYLGWDSSLNSGNGGARFFYLDGEKNNPGVFTYYDNNMNWNNETGVICPTYKNNGYTTAGSRVFDHTIAPATTGPEGMIPAQWKIIDLVSDSFTAASGSQGAKTFEMVFGAPDMIPESGETTGIENVNDNTNVNNNEKNDVNVYTINGQKVGTSLNGLSKGVYIVNGKKFIVK